MRTVHVVVPGSVDDPARPSGGNTYDRRICSGLRDAGWTVQVHALPGRWPRPASHDVAGLARTLGALPHGSLVVVDGLLASGHPDVVVPAADRLRLVVLVHLPLGHPMATDAAAVAGGTTTSPAEDERLALEAASAVITTSRWTADWLLASYRLDPRRVHVASPGADPADPATGTPAGTALLTVAAVVPAKGHTDLLDALASLGDRSWRLVVAGALDLAPDHVARLRERCAEEGLTDRVTFAGPLAGATLDREYAAADVLVVASRIETYGLVVTEALARALPVVASAVGGVEEAMGAVPGRGRPGLLVDPGPDALGSALRSWLDDAGLRDRLKEAARERRSTLAPWSATALRVAEVLADVSSGAPGGRSPLATGARSEAPHGHGGGRW